MRGFTHLALSIGVLSGCGGGGASTPAGGPPPTTTSLLDDGGFSQTMPLVAVDTIGVTGTDPDTNIPYAGVWIWNHAGACAFAQSGAPEPQGSALLKIEVANTQPGATSVAPGTYSIDPNGSAFGYVDFEALDATCQSQTSELAGTGFITLDVVSPTVISGTFDVLFAPPPSSADAGPQQLAGSFYGPVCAFDMANAAPPGSTTTCFGQPSGDP